MSEKDIDADDVQLLRKESNGDWDAQFGRERQRRRQSSKTVRIKMICLLLLGAVVMISHDRLYTFLDRRKAQVSDVGMDLQTLQFTASVTGAIFALIAKVFLSSVITMVIEQIFWMRLRRQERTIAEIDSAMSCKHQPFGWGARKSWRHMFLLSLISALALGNAQIVVFGAGSMVADYVTLNWPNCTVSTANLTQANIAVYQTGTDDNPAMNFQRPFSSTQAFVSQVVMSNLPYSPFYSAVNGKDDVLQTTQYSVQYAAPALECEDVSSSVDFASVLPVPRPNSSDPLGVWSGNYTWSMDRTMQLQVITRSAEWLNQHIIPGDNQEPVQCTFYKAWYNVTVFSDMSLLIEPELLYPLTTNSTVVEDIQMDAIADAFARVMNGDAVYDPAAFDFTASSPLIMYSPLGSAEGNQSPWSWSGNMTDNLPELMRKVSGGILSNFLSANGYPTLSNTSVPCQVSGVAFIYNRYRLMISYAVGLWSTIVAIIVGFYAIHVNGVEENMTFSRLLRSIVNGPLLTEKEALEDPNTKLRARSDEYAELHVFRRGFAS